MKQTILHVEAGRNLYGGAIQVTHLINALNPKRFRNILACPSGSEISKCRLYNCQIEPISMVGDLDVLMLARLGKLIEKHNVDIVHIHSRRGADLWGGLAALVKNKPAICTRRVDNKESRLMGKKYALYDGVVSISKGVHSVVVEHLKPTQRHPVILSSVDIERHQVPRERDWLARTYGVPKDHFVIANFAQLIDRKGQADLIQAMETISTRFPKTTCLLFGKGKRRQAYQQQIDNAGLGEHVRLAGFSDEVAKLLPNVDLVVHPAYTEGLGVILLQAAAASRPIVATQAGGIKEIVIPNNTGLAIEPGNPEQIVTAVTKLMTTPKLAETLGQRAHRHVADTFSINKMALQYQKLYQSLA